MTFDETVLGLVVEDERGSLPFTLLHGDALVACSAWALGAAGVQIVDATVPWSAIQEAGCTVVLHDPLCPLTPPDFIARCVEAVTAGGVVAGVRPVTDTVKVLEDGRVGRTVDRDRLLVVASPLVLSAEVCTALDRLPSLDFADLVTRLRERFRTELITAPPEARRVTSPDDVRVLEAWTQQPSS